MIQNMKALFVLGFIMCSMVTITFSQEVVQLWPSKMPNYKESDEAEVKNNSTGRIGNSVSKVQKASLEIYLPSGGSATGQAVIIMPGGGYGMLAYQWEGTDMAKMFNSKGIAAFVLKYRLPRSKSVVVSYEAPLQDAQRAIRYVRHNAKKFNVNSSKIGVMGFSAGGHLASTLGTRYEIDNFQKSDSIDAESARPDFMALIYPVITMKDNYMHAGSRRALLGDTPDPKLVDLYSNELHVNEKTPPTFIVHAADDKVVPVENSLQFYEALKKANVYTELNIFPVGGHGFSLAVGQPLVQSWPDRLIEFMRSLK